MAGGRDAEIGLGARLVIGAVAGMAATIAFNSTLARLRSRKDPAPPAPRGTLEIAAPFVLGAVCGAILAATNSRPTSVTGALAGGGLWLAGEMDWLPEIVVRPASDGRVPRSAALLAAHVAWGWSAAEAIRELSPDLDRA
jgi:hypothetical protein